MIELEDNHIRRPGIKVGDSNLNLCGALIGGSISFEHFHENPSNHLERVQMCKECSRIAAVRVEFKPDDDLDEG